MIPVCSISLASTYPWLWLLLCLVSLSTLVLLFVQPLQRYSHLPCFSWMARLMYTAPHIIKDNCRYWEGLLLFFRLTMATAFAGNIRSKIDVNLLAISLLWVLLAWSVGRICKKISLNILKVMTMSKNKSYIVAD